MQNWRDQGANADRGVARPDANPYPDTAGLGLRRQVRLTQLPLHDLAIGIARQRLQRQVDRLRHLVIREPLGAPGAQRLGSALTLLSRVMITACTRSPSNGHGFA